MSYIHLGGEALLRPQDKGGNEEFEVVKVIAFINGERGRKRTSRFSVRRSNGEEITVPRKRLRPFTGRKIART